MENKEMYTIGDIADKLDMDYNTVKKRFVSPYAEKRWGVTEIDLPDGSVRRFVPKEKLYLWIENKNYVGKTE